MAEQKCRRDDQNVPIALCLYALKKKCVKALALYLELRVRGSGKIRITTELKHVLATELGYKSIKSIENQLAVLKQLNWVGYYPKSRYHTIRSTWKIMERAGLEGKRFVNLCNAEIPKLNEFIIGAIVTCMLRRNHYLRRKGSRYWRTERPKRSSKHSAYGGCPVAVRFLAKYAGICPSRAHRLLSVAVKEQYLSRIAQYELCDISYPEINHYRSSFPEMERYFRFRKSPRQARKKGRLYIIQATLYVSEVKVKGRNSIVRRKK